MIRAAVENLRMQVRSSVMYKASEEIFHQLGLKIAHQPDFDAIPIDQRRAAPEIDRHHSERFIHRQDEIAGAVDAFAIAQGLRKQLSDNDTRVLDGVMLI